jgi:hypothetical protein
MSLSREMATMNEEELREAASKIATNFLARGRAVTEENSITGCATTSLTRFMQRDGPRTG